MFILSRGWTSIPSGVAIKFTYKKLYLLAKSTYFWKIHQKNPLVTAKYLHNSFFVLTFNHMSIERKTVNQSIALHVRLATEDIVNTKTSSQPWKEYCSSWLQWSRKQIHNCTERHYRMMSEQQPSSQGSVCDIKQHINRENVKKEFSASRYTVTAIMTRQWCITDADLIIRWLCM